MNKRISAALFALAIILAGGNVFAQSSSSSSSTTTATCGQAGGSCSEDFTGKSASLQWTHLNDACLTAGNGNGSIPACKSTVAGYSIPADEKVVGQGALLLTPPKNNQTGAILSNFPPFPLSQGINITFTTYTYGGDSGGTAHNGADGIVFFLTSAQDAGSSTINPTPTTAGGEGGSMGYDCSNGNGVYDGIAKGYLGLGIDEFGNFLNSGDNGSVGIYNSRNSTYGTTVYGDNSYQNNANGGIAAGSGAQYQPERIGLRGSGNTNWAWLNSQSNYYSLGAVYNQYNTSSTASFWTCSSNGTNCSYVKGVIGAPIWTCNNPGNGSCGSWTRAQANSVQAACRSGKYVSSYNSFTGTDGGAYYVPTGYTPIAYNYNAISGGYAVLPGSYVCTATDSNGNCTAHGYPVGSEPIANNSTSATRNSTLTPANIAWPITYQLKISSGGLLSFSYSYNGGAMTSVLKNTDITANNGPLPISLRFGFSAGTGGDNNVHEITCFKASPLTSTSSAAANTIQSGQYRTGTQIYLASYSANPWWGSLKAIPLVVDSNGDLAASNTATWDGKCTLTSGWCDSLGTDSNSNPVYNVQATGCGSSTSCKTRPGFVAPESRVLVTATGANATTGGSGVGFSMQTALTNYPTAVQTAFATAASTDSTTTPPVITMTGQNVLGWLLGQRCNEQLYSTTQSSNGPWMYSGGACANVTKAGNLNPRTYVLGDIIDSSPTWTGAPVMGAYNDTFIDGLYGNTVSTPENQNGVQTYSEFANSYATRLSMVYVGSNDGYLHGFEAGYFNTTSSSTTCGNSTVVSDFSDPCGTGAGNNDGAEKFSYMPYDVLLNQAANLASPLGSHQYLVDSTPGVGDLFYNNAWHTWLVGGVGINGKEIYALDVTNPNNFTTTQAQSLVMGDWDNNNTALSHLGNSMGTPQVVRMHDGQWAIIFGNGLNSGMSAGVYIGLVDKSTGAVTFQFLDTGVGSNSSVNGIAYATSVDLDGDGIVDYLYAGDQQGNVWRFDVTSMNPAQWHVSDFGNTASTCSNSSNTNSNGVITTSCSPLFTATSTVTVGNTSSTVPQPITTSIVTAAIQTNGVSRNMLYFGTGQQTPQTGSAAARYAPATGSSGAASQPQTFYGIWDWNMGTQGANGSGWNNLSSTQFASATGAGSNAISTSNLQQVTSTDTTVTGNTQIAGYRTLSAATTICWANSSTCSSGNTQYGWYYNLPGTNEQIIYSPSIIDGAVVVNTAIPPATSTTQCTANTQTGWTMAFDATSGGALVNSFFTSFNSKASGVQANAVGTPTAVTYKGQVYLVSQTVTGGALVQRVTPPNDNSPGRVSWREIRN